MGITRQVEETSGNILNATMNSSFTVYKCGSGVRLCAAQGP